MTYPLVTAKQLRPWIVAARPRTLAASIVPVGVGSAAAYGRGFHDPITAILVLACALLIQVGTNYANDLFDFEKGADTAERCGPLRVVQAGLVAPEMMRRALTLVLGAAFLIGCYLAWIGGWPIVAIGSLALLFAVGYTGGPFPLAYVGLGDLFVALFFGPVATGGTYYLLTGGGDLGVLLLGLGPGLLSTAILCVNNVRDREGDAVAGKRTLVVRFGVAFGRREYQLLIGGAVALPLLLPLIRSDVPLSTMVATLSLVPAIPLMRRIADEEDAGGLIKILEDTGRLLVIYGLLLGIGLVL
jgi:1,4-dihydroxy-2-naphthoate octaprenyltransferase